MDTFCLLMIEIEIIPARHHRAASCKVGLTPLSISRPCHCTRRIADLHRRPIVPRILSKERMRILRRFLGSSYAFRSYSRRSIPSLTQLFLYVHPRSLRWDFVKLYPEKDRQKVAPTGRMIIHAISLVTNGESASRCLAWQREARIKATYRNFHGNEPFSVVRIRVARVG